MDIIIRAEKSSGAKDSDKKRLYETIRYIVNKISYDCSDIIWIIYNPYTSEEKDCDNENQRSVINAMAEIEKQRASLMKKYEMVGLGRMERHKYGYCYIKAKRIYISIDTIRIPMISVYLSKVKNSYNNFEKSILNKSWLDNSRYKTEMLIRQVNNDDSVSLRKVVLHELVHIVTGKDDAETSFWDVFEKCEKML